MLFVISFGPRVTNFSNCFKLRCVYALSWIYLACTTVSLKHQLIGVLVNDT